MPAKRMYDINETADALRDASDALSKNDWEKVRALSERYEVVRNIVARMSTRDPNRDYEQELKDLIYKTLKTNENPTFEYYNNELFIQFDGKLGPIFKLEIKSRMRRRAKNEAPLEKVKQKARKRSDLPVKQQ